MLILIFLHFSFSTCEPIRDGQVDTGQMDRWARHIMWPVGRMHNKMYEMVFSASAAVMHSVFMCYHVHIHNTVLTIDDFIVVKFP